MHWISSEKFSTAVKQVRLICFIPRGGYTRSDKAPKTHSSYACCQFWAYLISLCSILLSVDFFSHSLLMKSCGIREPCATLAIALRLPCSGPSRCCVLIAMIPLRCCAPCSHLLSLSVCSGGVQKSRARQVSLTPFFSDLCLGPLFGTFVVFRIVVRLL